MPSYSSIDPQSLATIVSAAGSNVQEQAWMAKAIRRMQPKGQFSKIKSGAAGGRPILEVADTEKIRGQTVNITIEAPLGGPGVQGSSATRTGTGENQKGKMMSFSVGVLFKAKKWNNIAMNQCTLGSNNDTKGRNQLSDWHERRMSDCFEAVMLANRHARNTIYAGTATSIATLKSSDTWRQTDIVKGKNALLSMGAHPFNVAKVGQAEINRFFVAANNRLTEDMEVSGEWEDLLAQSQVRGDMNPIYTGSMPDYRGNIIQRHEIINSDAWGPQGSLSAPVAYLGEEIIALPVTGAEMKGGGSATGAALTEPKYFEGFPAASFTGYQDTDIIAATTGTECYVLAQHISGADAGKFTLFAYQVNNGNKITLTKKLMSTNATSGKIDATTVGSAVWGTGVYTSDYFSEGAVPVGSPLYPCNAKGQPYCFGYQLGGEAIVCGYGQGTSGVAFGRRSIESQEHGRDTEIGMEICWGLAPTQNADGLICNYAVFVAAWNPPGLPNIT